MDCEILCEFSTAHDYQLYKYIFSVFKMWYIVAKLPGALLVLHPSSILYLWIHLMYVTKNIDCDFFMTVCEGQPRHDFMLRSQGLLHCRIIHEICEEMLLFEQGFSDKEVWCFRNNHYLIIITQGWLDRWLVAEGGQLFPSYPHVTPLVLQCLVTLGLWNTMWRNAHLQQSTWDSQTASPCASEAETQD